MIQNIIRLLDTRPLEWTFDKRASYEREQLLHHKLSGLTIKLRFAHSNDENPSWVSINHYGADIGWWEHRKLRAAVRRLQRKRFDEMAVKYLENHRPPCYHCENALVCIKCDKI